VPAGATPEIATEEASAAAVEADGGGREAERLLRLPRERSVPLGSIRIIAGRFRGRKIAVPDAPGLRPTGGRAREALFDILGQDLTGRSVLDLYAGTGALGFEAASRGASRVVFVEADRGLAVGLRQTADTLGIAGSVRVVAGRVEDVLAGGALPGRFDVILADPPYGAIDPAEVAERVGRAGMLATEGVLVVEVARGTLRLDPSAELILVRSERYGGTSLLFFKYPKSGSPAGES
jgi:16S rRNA (guanine966-N2)-methyltransferase